MSDGDSVYDLAVSFAGEQRDYVEQVVRACQERGLRVAYDADLTVDLWGRNLVQEFRKVYGGARYVAPFISRDYLAKPYPMDEFRSMLLPAMDRPDDYMLPVLMGDVSVPPELLNPAVAVLRSEDYTAGELADAFAQRIKGVRLRQRGETPGDGMPKLRMPNVRMPATIPGNYSANRELRSAFRYLAEQFEAAAVRMNESGLVCTADCSDSVLSVRVEQRGRRLYTISISVGRAGRGEEVLYFALSPRGRPVRGNRDNGMASQVFDLEAGVPKLRMTDASVFGASEGLMLYTKQELFQALWDRLVDEVERRADHGDVRHPAFPPPPSTGSVRQSGGGTFIANTGSVGGDIVVREP
ncbi:toll/interleukin-1 receptor domain-containing protein [Streptomyces sp. NPDC005435]|uniref:toll/interleukin-1 receptor domain-containing protein n=1 Tax=Streptomyces sp. NPDC005435 TaxID=3154464 RepID=UPI0034523C74